MKFADLFTDVARSLRGRVTHGGHPRPAPPARANAAIPFTPTPPGRLGADRLALSDRQREAARAPDGPLAIVAGPGSGKTLVLAARIAYLVAEHGVPPDCILALAFSRQAATELRGRVRAFLGPAAAAVDVATFHAFGLRIVRRWGGELDYGAGEIAVAPAPLAAALLHATAAGLGLDLRGLPRVAASPGSPDTLYELVVRHRLDPAAPAPAPIPTLAAAYERRLVRAGLIDFPGMLAFPLRLFATHPPALAAYEGRYRHILCDEAQDLDPAQAALLGLLAAGHGNLTAVGDPLQALYAFRGATGAFLRDFPAQFGGAHVLGLTENFRATGQLVALANTLAATLPGGHRLTSADGDGPTAARYQADDEADEAGFVAARIAQLLRAGRVAHPGEIAVLARTNWQLAVIAPTLTARGIPVAAPGEVGHGDRVRLATIHQAKGSEWRAVFLIGCEEGLLPSQHALDAGDPGTLAGEHHAAYVAVTRPRQHLCLSSCRRRRAVDGDASRLCAPSRYFAVLAPALAPTARDPRAA